MPSQLPEKAAKALIKQVLTGLAHCHERGVVHRDLKVRMCESFSPTALVGT